MAIIWPSRFPSAPLRDAYDQARGSRLKRSPNPTSGPAKVRRKAGKRPDVITATWVFKTYAEFEDFAGWIDDVDSGLAGGLYAFDWTHPLSKQILRCRIVPESEDILYSAGPFKNTAQAWALSLTLEVLS